MGMHEGIAGLQELLRRHPLDALRPKRVGAEQSAPSLNLDGIDWVIYGGESGPGFRGHDLEWPRDMRRRCEAAGVAFFYKQSAAIRTEMGTELDGETVRNYPIPRKVQ